MRTDLAMCIFAKADPHPVRKTRKQALMGENGKQSERSIRSMANEKGAFFRKKRESEDEEKS